MNITNLKASKAMCQKYPTATYETMSGTDRALTGFHSPSLTVGVAGIPGVALRRLGRANKSAVDAATMSNLSVWRFSGEPR
jgi:hypothetical protein